MILAVTNYMKKEYFQHMIIVHMHASNMYNRCKGVLRMVISEELLVTLYARMKLECVYMNIKC